MALICLITAAFFTWPLILHPSSQIFGDPGDLTGGIALFDSYVRDGLTPFTPGEHSWGYPDGTPVRWLISFAGFGSTLFLWLASIATSTIVAFNAYVFLGFVATGTVAFGMLRWLRLNPVAAVFGGWAFAFFPFAVINARGHLDFVQGWVLVGALWTLLWLLQRITWRRAGVAGIACLVALTWSPYFSLFVFILMGVMLPVIIIRQRRQNVAWRACFPLVATAGIPALAAAVLLLAAGTSSTSAIQARPYGELFSYSARLHEFVTPGRFHPLWGDWAAGVMDARFHGSGPFETTLYLGLVVVALAGVALIVAILRRSESREVAWATAALGVLAIVSFAFTFPPRVSLFGLIEIPMPSEAVAQFTLTWRVFSRVTVVVMLAMACLAAVGLSWLLRRTRGGARYLIAALALGIIALEFSGRWPAPRTMKVDEAPLAYERLRDLPPGAVADYPMNQGTPLYFELWFQRVHQKPIVNGYWEGSLAERRSLQIDSLRERDVVQKLSALGVRYVIIRKPGYLNPGAVVEKPPRGLRKVADGAGAALYVVPNLQGAVIATLGEGFTNPEFPSGVETQWLTTNPGRIELAGRCTRCRATIRFEATSSDVPRRVTIKDAAGDAVARVVVPPGRARRVSFNVSFKGPSSALLVTTQPGPAIPSAEGAPTDPRTLSVALARFRASPANP